MKFGTAIMGYLALLMALFVWVVSSAIMPEPSKETIPTPQFTTFVEDCITDVGKSKGKWYFDTKSSEVSFWSNDSIPLETGIKASFDVKTDGCLNFRKIPEDTTFTMSIWPHKSVEVYEKAKYIGLVETFDGDKFTIKNVYKTFNLHRETKGVEKLNPGRAVIVEVYLTQMGEVILEII